MVKHYSHCAVGLCFSSFVCNSFVSPTFKMHEQYLMLQNTLPKRMLNKVKYWLIFCIGEKRISGILFDNKNLCFYKSCICIFHSLFGLIDVLFRSFFFFFFFWVQDLFHRCKLTLKNEVPESEIRNTWCISGIVQTISHHYY